MIKSINGYHILNTIIILAGIVVILRFTHLFILLAHGSTWYYIAPIGLALIIKNQLQPDSDKIKDPLFSHPWAKKLIYGAIGILMVAIMFKVMHWFNDMYLFFLSGLLQLAALITSYTFKVKNMHDESDLLDQFE